MLHQLPRHVPTLAVLLNDIGNPPPAAIGKALSVSTRTVQRWQADDEAPRSALLALFFVTRWGQSQVHCQAHNDAVLYASLAACRARQIVALEVEVSRLLRLGDFGCANDPTLDSAPQLHAQAIHPQKIAVQGHHG